MKKCIFHIPYKLDKNGKSAPMLRPKKMIEAFKNIGYEVFVIEGYSTERKKRIKELKRRIKQGEKYEFLYSESNTMPTLLTDPKHIPIHPFIDFSLIKFCKKNGIKTGLFYRDCYWRFPIFKKEVSWWKYYVSVIFHLYDLTKYSKMLYKLYLPSMKAYVHIHHHAFDNMVDVLPPGCDNINISEKKFTEKKRDFVDFPLQIFYVGGLGVNYDIHELLRAVNQSYNVKLTVCCRKEEWEKERENYAEDLSEKIEIVHSFSDELEPYYKKADICALLFNVIDENRVTAVPFKSFEYLAHEKPMLITENTAIADIMGQYGVSWNIKNDKDVIADTIKHIMDDHDELRKKQDRCHEAKIENTWEERAKKVAHDLS